MNTKQLTSSIMMIRPVGFGYNPETAVTNTFQHEDKRYEPDEVQSLALSEFNNFVNKLQHAGVEVIVFEDEIIPKTPDSIFPNNWVSFHEDGKVVLYPMQAHNRRLERKAQILERLSTRYHFDIRQIVGLSFYENEDKFLEGTGSMMLDRENKIAYACLSPRTNEEVLEKFCELMRYKPFTFHAVNENNIEIYHTNVMMAVGENIAIVCFDSVPDKNEREALRKSLEESGKTIVPISLQQMNNFAGNMLHVKNKEGRPILVMSDAGYRSLSAEQLNIIKRETDILHANLNCIERFGGGSARCMMAEIFTPKKDFEK
jgi:hypothetical protein